VEAESGSEGKHHAVRHQYERELQILFEVSTTKMSFGRGEQQMNNNTGRMEWNLEDIFTAENLYKEDAQSRATELSSILSIANNSPLDTVTNDNNTQTSSITSSLQPSEYGISLSMKITNGSKGSFTPPQSPPTSGSITSSQRKMSWNASSSIAASVSPTSPPTSSSVVSCTTSHEHPKLESMINEWLKEKELIGHSVKKRKSADDVVPMKGSTTTVGVSLPEAPFSFSTRSPPQVRPFTTSTQHRESDVHLAKSKLIDLLHKEINIESFSNKILKFVMEQLKAYVGGFYLNDSHKLEDWMLCSALPSLQQFSNIFHFNTGYNLILQAALQKHCFIVDTSVSNFSFMFAPVVAEEESVNPNGIGVIVLGLRIEQEEKTYWMDFLDNVVKVIAVHLRNIQLELHQATLWKKIDTMNQEKKVYSGNGTICTTPNGIITHFSAAASQLLGYAPNEMVGTHTSVLKLHMLTEVDDRARQLELELRRKIAGFQVFTAIPLMGRIETRRWSYLRKDGSTIFLEVSTEPLLDNNLSVVGFIFSLKEFTQ